MTNYRPLDLGHLECIEYGEEHFPFDIHVGELGWRLLIRCFARVAEDALMP